MGVEMLRAYVNECKRRGIEPTWNGIKAIKLVIEGR